MKEEGDVLLARNIFRSTYGHQPSGCGLSGLEDWTYLSWKSLIQSLELRLETIAFLELQGSDGGI